MTRKSRDTQRLPVGIYRCTGRYTRKGTHYIQYPKQDGTRHFFKTLQEAIESSEYQKYTTLRTDLRMAASKRLSERAKQTLSGERYKRTHQEIKDARRQHEQFLQNGGRLKKGIVWQNIGARFTYGCQSKFGLVRGYAYSYEEACKMIDKLSRHRSDAKARLSRNTEEVEKAALEAKRVLQLPDEVPHEMAWFSKYGQRKNVWVIRKNVKGFGHCTRFALDFQEAKEMVDEMREADVVKVEQN